MWIDCDSNWQKDIEEDGGYKSIYVCVVVAQFRKTGVGVVAMGLKQLLGAAFTVVLIQAWCCHACWEDERLALLQLHSSFNISDLTYLYYIDPNYYKDGSAWGESANCCEWRRIQCDAHTGRVTRLDLSFARERHLGDGYLNASLFLPFKLLSFLDLSSNRIIGCVENEGFERLQKLNNLEYLDLLFNNFSNDILSSLSGLSFLKSLNISSNRLKGSIHFEEFNNLKKLKELYMDDNEIEELIFFSGGKLRLSNLETLSLRNNRLNNNILSLLENLSSLKNLYLDHNQLAGPFNVTKLAALGNLEVLYLSGNENISKFVASKDFRGPTNLSTLGLSYMSANGVSLLLKSLPAFPYLKALYLGDNNLTGSTFHYEFQSFKNVEELSLDYSVVDEKFIVSLNALPSLKKLSNSYGSGLDNLQGLCNLNHLQSLDLSYSNFNGGLPRCLRNLSSLQYLDLSNSNFNGGSGLDNLQGLCNLNHLQSLDLSYNNLNGELPHCLADFSSLRDLDLSYNSLGGNLSSSPLTLMTSIQSLHLSHNNFQIPISLVPFYNCSKLIYLRVDGNELYADIESHNLTPKFQLEEVDLSCDACGGFFPRFFYHQHNLNIVLLSNNKMRGEFPYWLLENNTNLQWLDLSNNSFSGSIKLPSHLYINLTHLDISSNSFNGQIPTKIGSHFPSLNYLDMSHNEFTGSIPPSIGNMRWLLQLYLSNNQLSGNLPMFLGSTRLQKVYLSKNMLNGLLTDAFSKSTELKTLDLSHNFLTGNIPKWIGSLSYLNFLQLGHNFLDGEIPSEVCKLDQLSLTDLSNNNLYGHIPPCLKSNSISNSMEYYAIDPNEYVDFTTKSVSYSFQGRILDLIAGIDLSCNRLTGQIPPELGNLTDMKVLNLSHNSLGGPIPSTFSNLEEIESLDLSHNNLEGKIPSQLTQLNSISKFSVAYNNLSGKTPDMVKQFATFEDTSYEGNPFLCGKPLSKSCEFTISPSPLPGGNSEDDDGFMDMEVFYISFVVSYVTMLLGIVAVLYINPYWRRTWFYFIEVRMIDCYYFIVDLFKF